jgi:hypothetical protein
LYGWRDGTRADGSARLVELWLVPLCLFQSLEAALEEREALLRAGCWAPGWLPFFKDGGGGYWTVDLTPGADGVVGCFGEDVFELLLARSLGDALATVGAAFEAGLVSVGPDGLVNMDDQGFTRLGQVRNPGCPHWSER